ncbi:pentapeptide repeat-containing protein [Phenylobacterium sp.]|uniref:pentapeptide repeat-containing protein n=1 Tax=Phenylobacterium sp. TaxID=1871053 RepID=UPI002F92A534
MNQRQFTELFEADSKYRAWFKAWWDADYSVEGCRKSGINFPRAYSFAEFSGRRWTYGRSPPHDPEGRPNSEFTPLNHQSPIGNILHEFGPDLRGVWLFNFDERRLLGNSLSLNQALVLGRLAITGRNLESLSLDDAYVAGAVAVTSQVSSGISMARVTAHEVEISNARATVTLTDAFVRDRVAIQANALVLMERLRSEGAVHTSGDVRAERLRCKALTISGLNDSAFGRIDHSKILDQVQISGGAANYYLSAQDVQAGALSLEGVVLKRADFTRSRVNGRVKLGASKIAELDLRSGILTDLEGRGANIEFLRLDEAAFSGSVGLPGLQCETLVFTRSKCRGYCDLSDARIGTVLSAEEAQFEGRVQLSGAQLRGIVHLHNARFGAGLIARAGTSEFAADVGRANFLGAKFAPAADEICFDFDRRRFLEAATFDSAEFLGLAEFYGCEFHENVSFRNVKFEIAPSPYATGSRWTWVLSAGRALKADFDTEFYKLTNFRRCLREPPNPAAQLSENARLASYERAYNALRQRAEEINNAKYERFFHTLELRARRSRRWDRDAPPTENALSWLYDVSSEYGQSVSRPLIVLGLVGWIGFAAVYWTVAAVWSVEGALEALQFSARQIVKPFTVWSRDVNLPAVPRGSETLAGGWIENLFTGCSPVADLLKSLLVRVVGSVQSVVALALLFLSGLAVRRAFALS